MESMTATFGNPADEAAGATVSVTAGGDLNPPLAPLGTGFAYRAGVATVALGMVLAFLMLRGVPDNFSRPLSSK
jgi:hypothetical protein